MPNKSLEPLDDACEKVVMRLQGGRENRRVVLPKYRQGTVKPRSSIDRASETAIRWKTFLGFPPWRRQVIRY